MAAHLLLPLLLVAELSISSSGLWPQFRGPSGDGHAPFGGVPLTWSESENVAWKVPIHGRGWSSPVIWRDTIWLTTATDEGHEMSVVAVDLETGEIRHDKKLFDVAQPREIHKMNSYASPTPVVEEGRIYVHFGSYGTACLDAEDGKVLWSRRDLPCDHFRGPGSSPFLYRNLLILHYDGADYQYVAALDKQTGDTVWKTDRSNDYGTDDGDFKKAYSTPIVIKVDGRLQLISPGSKSTMAYDPLTGEEFWQVNFSQFSSTARPLHGHGLVFLNTGFSKAQLWAVRPTGQGNVTDTHVAWKLDKAVPSKPSAILVDDLLYMVNDTGVLSCVEATSGETVWTKRLGGNYSASPVLVDGHLLFCNHEGRTTVIRPGRTFQIVATNDLEDGFMASPAVVPGALILRTRSHLYRIAE